MRGEPITAGFALDEGFRRFYARFTISKVPMGCSRCSPRRG